MQPGNFYSLNYRTNDICYGPKWMLCKITLASNLLLFTYFARNLKYLNIRRFQLGCSRSSSPF